MGAMAQERVARYHRQVGVFASFWLVLAALTTLALNHRNLWVGNSPGSTSPRTPYGQYLLSHAFSPFEPNQILVGTADGVFFSDDGGKIFREISLPVKASQVVGVAFHPGRPDQLYVAMRDGLIFASIDGGKQWDRVAFPGTSTIQSFSVNQDGAMAVLSPEGIYLRSDQTWSLRARPQADSVEDGSRRWLRWVYALHDGQVWGRAAVFVTDSLALAILFMVTSGLMLATGRLPIHAPTKVEPPAPPRQPPAAE